MTMRYYDLKVFLPSSSEDDPDPFLHYSTHLSLDGKPCSDPYTGLEDPAFPRIQFEYTLTNDSIIPDMLIRIYGISDEALGQVDDLTDGTISLSAGILDDNSENLSAILDVFNGKISLALGQRAEALSEEAGCAYLEIYAAPKSTHFQPKPVFFSCEEDDTLALQIKTALSPYDVNVDLLQDLKCVQYERFQANTMAQFVDQMAIMTQGWGQNWLKDWKDNFITGYYNSNGTIYFSEANLKPESQEPTRLSFDGIIGQPMYDGMVDKNGKKVPWEVTVTTPLRTDIGINEFILLPSSPNQQNVYGLLANFFSPDESESFFSGVWQVLMIHHSGDSRDPDGHQWRTVFGLKRAV